MSRDESEYGLSVPLDYLFTQDGAVAHLVVAFEYVTVDAGAHYIEVTDVQCKSVEPAERDLSAEAHREDERYCDGFWRFLHRIDKRFQAECQLAAWAHWRKTGGDERRVA